MGGETRLSALGWADHEEVIGDLAKDLAAMTHRILTLQSDLADALKREDTLVTWLLRFLDIAGPAESMAHLDETESLDLLTEEIKQALEPYAAHFCIGGRCSEETP